MPIFIKIQGTALLQYHLQYFLKRKQSGEEEYSSKENDLFAFSSHLIYDYSLLLIYYSRVNIFIQFKTFHPIV